MASDTSVGFTRSLTTLLTGTVLAQAIPFLAAPVIARLFGAPQFALFGGMIAVFNVLSVLVTGRYELAVMVPKERSEAAHLVRGGLLFCVLASVGIYGLLLAFHRPLELHTGIVSLHNVLAVLALLALFAGTQQVVQQWLLRERAFKAMAQVKVVQALGITALTLLAGWLGWKEGLVLGYLGGWLLFAGATVFLMMRTAPLPDAWDRRRSLNALAHYKDWPLHNAWPALLNAMASGGAVIYMGLFYNAETAGQHNFARQYLLVPISMVTVALGQVVFERMSSRIRERQAIGSELRRIVYALVLLALAGGLVVTLAGPWLFDLVFGAQWSYAGTASRILIWGYAMQLVASPLGVVLLALGRVKLTMVFPLIYGVLMVLPFFARHMEAMQFMTLLAAIEVVAYGAYLVLVRSAVRAYDQSLVNA
ncbi:MAG: oligosaccharide flippase family protein [Flavobacteriales bacterium]|nr:oligosaccharide flippase family protein [Flavobacteriales bacterium]MBL0035726.1 oligosaccharide flippase family protein [Flavobacteriales bacterium]